MKNTLTAERSIIVNSTPSKIWEALTTPSIVKQYLFGTDVSSDWKEGSPVRYRGEWQGKSYEDKGVVKKVEPGKLLVTTYWSSMGGKEDKPENYATVSYKISPEGN